MYKIVHPDWIVRKTNRGYVLMSNNNKLRIGIYYPTAMEAVKVAMNNKHFFKPKNN